MQPDPFVTGHLLSLYNVGVSTCSRHINSNIVSVQTCITIMMARPAHALYACKTSVGAVQDCHGTVDLLCGLLGSFCKETRAPYKL